MADIRGQARFSQLRYSIGRFEDPDVQLNGEASFDGIVSAICVVFVCWVVDRTAWRLPPPQGYIGTRARMDRQLDRCMRLDSMSPNDSARELETRQLRGKRFFSAAGDGGPRPARHFFLSISEVKVLTPRTSLPASRRPEAPEQPLGSQGTGQTDVPEHRLDLPPRARRPHHHLVEETVWASNPVFEGVSMPLVRCEPPEAPVGALRPGARFLQSAPPPLTVQPWMAARAWLGNPANHVAATLSIGLLLVEVTTSVLAVPGLGLLVRLGLFGACTVRRRARAKERLRRIQARRRNGKLY